MKTLQKVLWTTAAVVGFALVFTPAPVAADICHLDDVIIDGSLCVGFDCVCNMSFGFDTIVLRENNLRIFFDDTSNSASFPTNNWRIRINDSTNGGASYFAVEDSDGGRTPFLIEAGAIANALYVDSAGDVGIGTSNPVVDLHAVDGNTPTLRLEQNGTSGFTPQTWDVAGNETNFFIRDVTMGSQLPFRIRPGAPTNSIFIDTDGDVGMGTASPSAGDGANRFLEVKDSTSAALVVDGGDGTGEFAEFLMEENNVAKWSFGYNANDNRFYIFNYPNLRQDISIADATGVVTVENGLVVNGGCTGCDAVFQPGWPLETIEQHAESMFENSYLPAVGPTPEGQTSIDVFQKTTGILQELEKAHIYIAQLNETVQQLQQRLEELEAQ